LSEPDRNGISAKLRRLPREFLLALINGTAILVIVAAILVLVAMVRIDNFAGNVVATMTEAALSKIDLPSKDVLANLRNLTEEVRTLGIALREIKTGENPVLQSEIARLKEALTALNMSVDRLRNARTILTDEAIGQLGRSVTDTLTKMRGCASNVGEMQPHRTLGDNVAESGQISRHQPGTRSSLDGQAAIVDALDPSVARVARILFSPQTRWSPPVWSTGGSPMR
jgi:hypothetical protein